jgi:hypothetical protein
MSFGCDRLGRFFERVLCVHIIKVLTMVEDSIYIHKKAYFYA